MFILVGLPIVFVGLGYLLYRDLTRLPPPVAVPCIPSSPGEIAATFSDIYARGRWGRNPDRTGTSGGGSTLAATTVYRAYVQDFLEHHQIRSVVDAGCGDWEFSRTIDWSGIDYKGYDVVPSVIAGNTAKYGSPTTRFFTADILATDLPPADLLICKDVLQHLPNQDVLRFLSQLGKYKYVLLTNTVDAETLTANNDDIKVGEFHRLDMTRPPFDLPGKKVLTYFDGEHTHQVVLLVQTKR